MPPLMGASRMLARASARPVTAAAVALGLVALLVRAPLIAVGAPEDAGDTLDYLAIARSIVAGDLEASGFRTPGYPVVLALLWPLPGSPTTAVVVLQHLLGVALVVGIAVLGWRRLGPVPAVVAAWLAAITPVMAGLEHNALPDFLFGLVALLGGLALVRAMEAERRLPLLVATGLAFAAAAYLKGAGLFLPAAVPLAHLIAGRGVRAAAGATLVVGIAFALAVVPWVVRNGVATGQWSFSIQGGQTLFKRVFDVDRRPIPTDIPEGRVVKRFADDLRRDRSDDELNSYVSRRMRERGATTVEVVELQGRVARHAIREDPLAYAGGTVRATWRYLTDVNEFSRADLDDAGGGVGGSGPLRIARDAWFAVARVSSWAWFVYALAGLAMLAALRSRSPRARVAAAVLFAVWLPIALGTAASHGGLRRYSAQLAPVVWLLGTAGTGVLIAALRERTGSRRSEPRPERV